LETDWFVASLDALEAAAAEAQAALADVVEYLVPARQSRLTGDSLLDIIDTMAETGGPESRRDAGLALQRYEQASQSFRAEVIRHFVADEGLSMSESARIMRISRQRAARILASASDPLERSSPDPAVAPASQERLPDSLSLSIRDLSP
jgi:hypothetical protein